MAIGTAAAILGSAAIGAGASAISGSSSKKEIHKATDAQVQVARESNALAQAIYNQNSANLKPFMARGNAAGDTINALLNVQPASGETYQMANERFKNFIANSDYGFRENEGERGLGAKLSALGGLESGAAQKALQQYRTNLQSGYRGQYFDLLSGQQNVGLSGANALAGVGTNYVGAVTSNNRGAADAISNGALARAGVNNSMIGGIAGALGGALGGLGGFGSSYGAYGIRGSDGIY